MAECSKGVDAIDYFTVLRKLHSLNISTLKLNLIANYITERIQYLQVNGKYSSHKTVNFGVPLGSILGRILFNIYVNDMKEIYDDCTWNRKRNIYLF